SLVETLARAASEKSPIFFWLAAPYWRTCWLLVMSIFAAKSSTIFCSSGDRRTSFCSGSGFFSSSGAGALRSPVGSRVRLGAAGMSKSKFRELLSAIARFILSQNHTAIVWFSAVAADIHSMFMDPRGKHRRGPCARSAPPAGELSPQATEGGLL